MFTYIFDFNTFLCLKGKNIKTKKEAETGTVTVTPVTYLTYQFVDYLQVTTTKKKNKGRILVVGSGAESGSCSDPGKN